MKECLLKFFVILCTCLCSAVSFGQKIALFEDTNRKIPISGASVIALDLESQEEMRYTSDENGAVLFSGFKPERAYKLTIYQYGFEEIIETVYGKVDKIFVLEERYSTVNGAVVTAQFAPNNPEKAVHNISIIDSKKIAAMGAVNLRDVMMNEPNVRVSQDNILGSGFSLQGISGQNVKILIDGIPVIGRVGDNIDPSQINLNNVERIEIVKGPLSVSYGTDALAGTINIITKRNKSNDLTANTEALYESIGQYNLIANLGFGVKKHSFLLSGGRNYFDGWNTGDKPFYFDFHPVGDSSRIKTWNPKEQYFSTFNYGYRFKNLDFSYVLDYFQETIQNKGLPEENATTVFAKDDYYKTNRLNNGVTIVGELSPKYRLNAVVAYNYFQRNKNSYVKDLTDLQQNLSIDAGAQDTSVFTSLMSRATVSNVNRNSAINYEIGYDLRHDGSKGERIKGDHHLQTMSDYAAFSALEWTVFDDLVIRPGVRFAYNSKYDAPIIPSLNLKYGISTNKDKSDKITFRASYAKGFRSPSLKELYFDFVDINHNITGNSNLQAEKSNNFDFATNYLHRKGNFSSRSEISAFYNIIDNQITLAATDSTGVSFKYINLDFNKTVGGQVQQSIAYRRLQATVGFALTGRYNIYSDLNNSATFLFTPEYRFNIFYEWAAKDMTFGLFYKYNGEIPAYQIDAVSQDIIQVRNSAFSWADFSIAKRFSDRKFEISLGAKNLFNVTSITSSAVSTAHSGNNSSMSVGTGRGYFAKIAYHFGNNK